jgi:hypothetical protein
MFHGECIDLSRENEQEARRILEKYGEFLSEEERTSLGVKQPQNARSIEQPSREAKALSDELARQLARHVLGEIQEGRSYCQIYLIAVLVGWYHNVISSTNVVSSSIFVLCVWRILSYRRRDYLNREHVQKSCLYMSLALFAWGLQVICFSKIYQGRFILLIMCFFVPSLLFIFRKYPSLDDIQNGFILFLGYNLLLFSLVYLAQLRWFFIYPFFAWAIKKSIDVCRNAWTSYSYYLSYRYHLLPRVFDIFCVCLLVDTMKMTSGTIIFDTRYPLYMAMSELLVGEILARDLIQKYAAVKKTAASGAN